MKSIVVSVVCLLGMDQQNQKILKTLPLKILTFFLCLTVVSTVTAQSLKKGKNKSLKQKDSIAKSKSAAVKSDKTLSLTDTLKKGKTFFAQQSLEIDSLFVDTGKYKFYKKGAHASYYADKFHNRRTASGRKYDMNKYTAAHKKLPFGTKLKITNEANNKSVIVEVIDRGPFVRSREIDLSRRAFMEITSNKSSGNMKVTIEILQK